MSKAYREWKKKIKECNRFYSELGTPAKTSFSYYKYCIHFNQSLFGKHFDKRKMVVPRGE